MLSVPLSTAAAAAFLNFKFFWIFARSNSNYLVFAVAQVNTTSVPRVGLCKGLSQLSGLLETVFRSTAHGRHEGHFLAKTRERELKGPQCVIEVDIDAGDSVFEGNMTAFAWSYARGNGCVKLEWR